MEANLPGLGIAFSHGLLSSLSACVYPLIPITTALFGGGQVKNWLHSFALAAIYVAGMAVTYVALGVIAALSGTVFGSYLGMPEVSFAFGVAFILLGLAFIGILPLPLPNFADKLQVKKSSSIFYPLVLGIFSGFIAAPCTAPLFGGILLEIANAAAESGSVTPGITQALAFSLGMGLPFLLIGGFALKLPKPGNWLNTVKYIGGVVLIAAGFHYIEDIIGPFPSAENIKLMVAVGIFLFILFFIMSAPLSHPPAKKSEKLKPASFLIIAAFGLFLITSPFAARQSQQPADGWYQSLDAALGAASENNSPVLIDFWAEWCVACHKMEEQLFPSAEFKELVEKHNLTLARLDFTDSSDSDKIEIAQKYYIKGLPTLVLTDSEGNMLHSFVGYKSKAATLAEMQTMIPRALNSE